MFAEKLNTTGKSIRHKAHIVTHRYTQIHGINYNSIHSPVARCGDLRLITYVATTIAIPCLGVFEKRSLWPSFP